MTGICFRKKATRVSNEFVSQIKCELRGGLLYTVTCSPVGASCFDYAAENSNVNAVGCNLHLSLKLPSTHS